MRFGRKTMFMAFCVTFAVSPSGPARAIPTMDVDALRAAVAEMNDATVANRPESAFNQLRNINNASLLSRVPLGVVARAVMVIADSQYEGELDEFSSDLAASSSFARLDPSIQRVFAFHALSHAGKIGDIARVESLLTHFDSPEDYFELLSDRKYEGVWPTIEQRAGDHLANILDRQIELAAENFRQKPQNRGCFIDLVYALVEAGNFEDAASVIDTWHKTNPEPDVLTEEVAGGMNSEANNLVSMGKGKEADRIFDRIGALSPSKYPGIDILLMNRVVELTKQGRWEEALAASNVASIAKSNSAANPFVAASRVCALYKLGRQKEAAADVKYLRDHFDEMSGSGVTVTTTGFLCAGMEDEVEERLAKLLPKVKYFRGYGEILVTWTFEGFKPPSMLPDAVDFIFSREALRKELLKHVRQLPDRLMPLGYIRARELQTKLNSKPS